MKISPQWLRDFVDLDVNYHQLADDLTLAGIAVETGSGEGDGLIFEMDITTNRPDAMNHYGVARECSAIYDLALKAIEPQLSVGAAAKQFAEKYQVRQQNDLRQQVGNPQPGPNLENSLLATESPKMSFSANCLAPEAIRLVIPGTALGWKVPSIFGCFGFAVTPLVGSAIDRFSTPP